MERLLSECPGGTREVSPGVTNPRYDRTEGYDLAGARETPKSAARLFMKYPYPLNRVTKLINAIKIADPAMDQTIGSEAVPIFSV